MQECLVLTHVEVAPAARPTHPRLARKNPNSWPECSAAQLSARCAEHHDDVRERRPCWPRASFWTLNR